MHEYNKIIKSRIIYTKEEKLRLAIRKTTVVIIMLDIRHRRPAMCPLVGSFVRSLIPLVELHLAMAEAEAEAQHNFYD